MTERGPGAVYGAAWLDVREPGRECSGCGGPIAPGTEHYGDGLTACIVRRPDTITVRYCSDPNGHAPKDCPDRQADR